MYNLNNYEKIFLQILLAREIAYTSLSHLNTRTQEQEKSQRKITQDKDWSYEIPLFLTHTNPLNNLLNVNTKQISRLKNTRALFCFFLFVSWRTQIFIYFQIFTDLSWLAEAIIPVIGEWANAEMTHSWAGIVIHLFSFVFQSSSDCNTFVYHKFKSFRIK